MANPAINREKVHALAEACSDQGEAFQPVATRLIKHQRRLSRFFEQNVAEMGPMASQVGLYMLSVSLRIFDQVGGRMGKVNGDDLNAATAKENGDLSKHFNVSGIPAAAVVKGGKIVWRGHPGRLSDDMINGWL